MQKKKLIAFRIVAILLMGQTFLPILFENLPGILSSYALYLGLWFILLFIYYPKIYISKAIRYIYFFIIVGLFFLYIKSYTSIYSWYDISFVGAEILNLMVPISVFVFFIKKQDFEGLELILKLTLLFCTITAITSIIGLSLFPMAARNLGGKLAAENEIELIERYKKLGIASTSFFHGLCLIFPILILLIKTSIGKKFRIYIIVTIILLYSIVKSQFTTPFIFSILGIITAIFLRKHYKRTLFLTAIFLIILVIIPEDFYAKSVYFIADKIKGGVLSNRIEEIALIIEGESNIETHYDQRAARIPALINSFLKSPFIGGGFSSGHVYWLDKLSFLGILGLLPWILLVYYYLKLGGKILTINYRLYYILSFSFFIAMGFMKNITGHELYTCIFFIVPSYVYLINRKELIRKMEVKQKIE